MLDGIGAFWYLFPVLLLVLNFFGGLAIRILPGAHKMKQDFSYQPKVSILLPVYNEGAHVMDTIKSIVESNWPHEKLEIIAVDDCSSDDSFHYVQGAAKIWPQVRAFKNETNAGKHVSLSRALSYSTGEILICIDSDCIFDVDAVKELVSCFADEKVGAVGGNIGVTNVNENMYTVCQTLVYYASFQAGKMIQNLSGHLFCISGCLFAVRRELFFEVESAVKNRNWFGMGVRDGEDRYMTHAIMMNGWKTILNPKAWCWTAVPSKMSILFSQQIRWRRSGLRDLFWTWRRFPEHIKVIGFWPLAAAIIPESFTALWPILVLSTFISSGIAATFGSIASAMIFFASIYLASAVLYNKTAPKLSVRNQKIINPLLAIPAGAWFFMDATIITLLALFTFDVGAWGTREAKKITKEKI